MILFKDILTYFKIDYTDALLIRLCLVVKDIRAGSLNHFSGEPDWGAPNFSQAQRDIIKMRTPI